MGNFRCHHKRTRSLLRPLIPAQKRGPPRSVLQNCPVFCCSTLIIESKTSVKEFLKINVNKGLTNVGFRLLLAFGSFLATPTVYGNELRAMSDFLGGKSMSGRWVLRSDSDNNF